MIDTASNGSGGRRMRWLLIASLALNVFLAALFTGLWFADWRDGPRHRRPPPMLFGLGSVMRELPPQDREGAKAALERHRPVTRAAFERMREAHRGVRAALAAEPYDTAALERALAAFRDAAGGAHAEMHKAMVEVAAGLSPEARKAMAESMQQRVERRRRHSSDD